MNKLWIAILILATIWLQVNFLGALRPFGVVPNVMLITVALVALTATASEAIMAAIVGGCILDSLSGADFGLRTAFYSLVALGVISGVRGGVDFEKLPQMLGLVTLATVSYNLAVLANLVFLRLPIPLGHVLAIVGAELAINMLILLPARPVISRVLAKSSAVPVISRPTGATR